MGKTIEQAMMLVITESIAIIQRRHLEGSASIDAALLLAKRGKSDQALKTLMDFEGPTRDALDIFNAMLTLNREFGMLSEPRVRR